MTVQCFNAQSLSLLPLHPLNKIECWKWNKTPSHHHLRGRWVTWNVVSHFLRKKYFKMSAAVESLSTVSLDHILSDTSLIIGMFVREELRRVISSGSPEKTKQKMWVFIRREAPLMSTYNIWFTGKTVKMIPELSLNTSPLMYGKKELKKKIDRVSFYLWNTIYMYTKISTMEES